MKKDSSAALKGILKKGRFLIPYRVYENKGPHVVCINGIQQSMGMWLSFVSRFGHRYRITIFDFPNQGKAKIVSGPARLSMDEQVGILKAVMDKTQVRQGAVLCAASWGGVVAVNFAVNYPYSIKALVLASLGTRPNKKMVDTIKQGAALNMNDRDKMADTLIESFGNNLPLHFKKKITVQFRSMTEENIRTFYEHGLFVISSKKLNDLVDLSKIRAKTVLLIGENDTIIDLEDVKFMSSQIPNCELKVVKGVGHFLHMEREDVLDIYEDILLQTTKK